MVIFFDIDDTLVDSESAHLNAIKELCIKKKVPKYSIFLNQWIDITNKYLTLYFENKITLEEQQTNRIIEFLKLCGQNISKGLSKEYYQLYYKYFINSCQVFNDTIYVLNNLKDYKLGIISNGLYTDQIYKLENNGILQFFDTIVVSEEVGFSKPEKEIFQIAANRAFVTPSECIYIGNSYELDYLGSLNAGMKSIWLNRKNLNNVDFNTGITSLIELLNYNF